MKKGIEGEKIVVISLVIIIIITLSFSIYTIFKSTNSLQNNSTTVDLKNNGENLTPSNGSKDNNNNNNNNNNNITNEDIDKMNIDENIDISNVVPKKEPEQIATYTTTIYDTDTNRVDNISLANSKLNGHIVKVGEEFSFNNVIGPMDESQGFKKALGFDGDGNKIDIPGGGICQISSTLYNAVLIANLEVTERHPHSHRVYYVPQDKDATIFYGTYDLKFINNTFKKINIFIVLTVLKSLKANNRQNLKGIKI